MKKILLFVSLLFALNLQAQFLTIGTYSGANKYGFLSRSAYDSIATIGGQGWKITGNAGTVDGTNFIGTTDAIALNFRVNNTPAGKISTSGLSNSFYGLNSGIGITTGFNNTGIGFQTLSANTNGQTNTAIGFNSLVENIGGGFNTGLGAASLILNTSGSNNTAVGWSSLNATTTGSNNTALGYSADVSATINNSTAIGANSSATTSNSLVLGEVGADSIRVGIGLTNPTIHTKLDIFETFNLSSSVFKSAININIDNTTSAATNARIKGIAINAKNSCTNAASPFTMGLEILTQASGGGIYGTQAFLGQRNQLVGTIAQTGTLTDITNLLLMSPSWSATVTPTSAYGLTVKNQGISGTTTSAAINIEAQSGSTTNHGILSAASIVSTSTSGGVGYFTGAGGAITQGTSRTTGVTVNNVCGQITMFSAAGSAVAASFTVTNSSVAASDVIILNQRSGTNLYNFIVTAVTAGSFQITFYTTGGIATDAPLINFSVMKAVAN